MKPRFKKGQIVHCLLKEGRDFLTNENEYLLVLKAYRGTNDIPLYKVWAIKSGIIANTYLSNNHLWDYKVYKHE
jgi:hypothetical protein